jgi:hypothetical protein
MFFSNLETKKLSSIQLQEVDTSNIHAINCFKYHIGLSQYVDVESAVVRSLFCSHLGFGLLMEKD